MDTGEGGIRGRCADCRWWQTPMRKATRVTGMHWDEARARYLFPEEEYEYAEKPANPGWRVCTREGEDGALMRSISHDDGVLETAPDFGCVMFQPREEAP